jgi:ElaB/YqjD/DUF883 family membrane-anchored ribosome-binding protein
MLSETGAGRFPGDADDGGTSRIEAAKEAVGERAHDAAESGKERVAGALEGVAARAHAQAEALEGRGGVAGRAAKPAHRAADAVESGAEYLRLHEWAEIRDDVEDRIRSRPLVAVAVAFGAGLLLARAAAGKRGSGIVRGRPRRGGRSRALAPIRNALLSGVTTLVAKQLQERVLGGGDGAAASYGRPGTSGAGVRTGARF